jgi:ribose-phosphate pyrophosphokinase
MTASHPLRLLAGTSAVALARAVSQRLGVELSAVRVERFANENLRCDVSHVALRGADVAYVQTASAPVSDHLLEALFTLDAIRLAAPARVTAVLPYFPYARSDKQEVPAGPVQARLVAELLEHAGAQRIVAFDLHSSALAGFFRVPVLELSALPTLVAAVRAWQLPDLAVASPDLGGAKRAERAAAALGAPLVLFRKRRQGREVSSELLGEVGGRSLVIFDDEIASGATMIAAARLALERGARRVCAAATHAVFAGDALRELAKAGLERVLVSDTLEPQPAISPGPKLEVVSVAPQLADALRGG